jgi:hypothetical protein
MNMIIAINKSSNARKPVQYAALASGTISHVWSDAEESGEKRTVKVMARSAKKPAPSDAN